LQFPSEISARFWSIKWSRQSLPPTGQGMREAGMKKHPVMAMENNLGVPQQKGTAVSQVTMMTIVP